jgi:hypothetical protein
MSIRWRALVALVAPTIAHTPAFAQSYACSDSEYVHRLVSIDRFTVHGRNRKESYLAHFADKERDTVYVGYHPSKIGNTHWFVRFADDTMEYPVDRFDAWTSQVRQPTPATIVRFRTIGSAMLCLPPKDLKRWIHPPEPHAVTYDDIIFAQMEPSYITIPFLEFGLPKETHRDLEENGPPKDLGLLYEAVIAPPFMIRSEKRKFTVAVTPRVVLRQLSGGSAPVPPPSYMPRATLYYWGPGVGFLRGGDPNVFPYSWFMFSHHSNGQEGSPIDTAGTRNYATGNFSMNYVELGLSRTRSEPAAGFAGTQLSVTYHPPAWADAHQHLYGNTRIRVAEDLIAPLSLGSNASSHFRLELTWMGGPMGPAFQTPRRRFNYSGTVIFNPLDKDFATFLNGYDGQDYYNIRYDRRIRIIRMGVIATSLHFKFGVPKIP